MPPERFEKDFGYLMPFLDRVAEAGRQLGGPAGQELSRLLAGEKERWARIRALLGGAAGDPSSPAAAPSEGEPLSRAGFTVGPLKPR